MTKMFFIFLSGALAFTLGCSGGSGGSGGDPSQKATNQNCYEHHLSSGPVLTSCVRLSELNKKPRDIIYYLHGYQGSAEEIFSNSPIATQIYEDMKFILANRLPHIVSLSYGPSETIPVELGSNLPSITTLIEEMDRIEAKLGYDPSDLPQRHLAGVSLGGFNALNFAALAPNLFTSVSALCPALINIDPFSDRDIDAYLATAPAYVDRNIFTRNINMLRFKFGTLENWQTRDPLDLARHAKYNHQNLFVSIGNEDHFGFYEGALEFVRLTTNAGNGAKWSPVVEGHHCSFDSYAWLSFMRSFMNGP